MPQNKRPQKASPVSANILSVLKEKRVFKPAPEFSRRAHVKSLAEWKKLSRAAAKNPEAYWAKAAKELDWFAPWKKVLQWNPPFAKWFSGGKINIAHNCLDRHLKTDGEKGAIILKASAAGLTGAEARLVVK